jgi:S1-C subfamily serine protease
MNFIKRSILMVSFVLAVNANALTTQEIVNQSLTSIVTIVISNSKTNERWEGTGWFIAANRIVTNSHVAASKETYDEMQIINVATGQKYSIDHLSYNNVLTDVAVITVNESNPSHLNLSTRSTSPAPGIPVIIIGNPGEQYGRVIEGMLGETVNSIPDKHESGMLVIAPIIGGSSGSPVIDPNGEVVGMIWGASDDHTKGLAVNIQTLTLAQLDSINVTTVVTNAPSPSFSPSQEVTNEYVGLPTPKNFGATRQGKTYTFTMVTDKDAYIAIAGPVVVYIQKSLEGANCAGLFMMKLGRFYDQNNITYIQAKAIDDAYNVKWVKRSIKIDYANVTVERVNWDGDTTYMVGIPITWRVTDKHGKTRTGSGHTIAYVQPSHHHGTNEPAYFIASIWAE